MSVSTSVRETVQAVLQKTGAHNVAGVCEGLLDARVADKITKALVLNDGFDEQIARDIGFHLSDWHADAAFILALHLSPEHFTPAEIAQGVREILLHAPNHLAAAAALYGYPVEDMWELRTRSTEGVGQAPIAEQ